MYVVLFLVDGPCLSVCAVSGLSVVTKNNTTYTRRI
jgi:hypothetical protein